MKKKNYCITDMESMSRQQIMCGSNNGSVYIGVQRHLNPFPNDKF